VTLGNDNGTDGQTDRQTGGQSATHNAAPSLGGGPRNNFDEANRKTNKKETKSNKQLTALPQTP